MAPDDPRHGTPAGAVAGCKGDCCQTARRRQQKRRRALNYAGHSAWATPEQASAAVEKWRRMGFHDSAILAAAGLSNDHAIRGNRLRMTSLTALWAITEADFDDTAKVPSDLTRRRVHSLMAAGHRLADMPIEDRGQWRYRDHIHASAARAMRDYYAANEFKIGPSRQTEARARNAGHAPPLSWDDPGTLAWPDAQLRVVDRVDDLVCANKDYDEVVVERFLTGDHKIRTSRPERSEIVARWTGAGRSLYDLERVTGWKSERYTDRTDGAA